MKKLLNKREVIIRRPFTNEYDVAHIVKEYQVTQYGVQTNDYDFHINYFTAYDSKAEAEAAKVKDEQWARKMGDNEYFYVTSRETIVRRFFDIDMKKRAARAQLKGNNSYEEDFLDSLAKAIGFTKDVIQLNAIGLYYPKGSNKIPPLTENYSERAEKVYYIYLPTKDKEFLVFNPGTFLSDSIEVKNFDLNGAHIRWSDKSILRPWLYDSTEDKKNWDLEDYFDFEEAPEF